MQVKVRCEILNLSSQLPQIYLYQPETHDHIDMVDLEMCPESITHEKDNHNNCNHHNNMHHHHHQNFQFYSFEDIYQHLVDSKITCGEINRAMVRDVIHELVSENKLCVLSNNTYLSQSLLELFALGCLGVENQDIVHHVHQPDQ